MLLHLRKKEKRKKGGKKKKAKGQGSLGILKKIIELLNHETDKEFWANFCINGICLRK